MTTATATATAQYPEQEIAPAIASTLVAVRDRPDPDLDVYRSAQKYAGMAQVFRAGAWEHLRQGDLPQASNKAWGLVAETVKAISAQHGGVIHTHRAIIAVIDRLARLAGDAGDTPTRDWINNSFMVARGLHTNFYENEMTEAIVHSNLRLCEELSDRLYELFWPEGAAFDGNIWCRRRNYNDWRHLQ